MKTTLRALVRQKFCHICSLDFVLSCFVLFSANGKVQFGGVANCFDFCAICYLHLNLQIFCGQEEGSRGKPSCGCEASDLGRSSFCFGCVYFRLSLSNPNVFGFAGERSSIPDGPWQMHKPCSEGLTRVSIFTQCAVEFYFLLLFYRCPIELSSRPPHFYFSTLLAFAWIWLLAFICLEQNALTDGLTPEALSYIVHFGFGLAMFGSPFFFFFFGWSVTLSKFN